MKRYSVNITDKALNDIRDIKRHIKYKLRNPEAASLIVDGILSSAETLEIFPEIYRVRRKDSDGRKLRFIPHGHYVIIYYVDDVRQIVEVLHVVYEKRNLESLMH